jgi:hypothetical protein
MQQTSHYTRNPRKPAPQSREENRQLKRNWPIDLIWGTGDSPSHLQRDSPQILKPHAWERSVRDIEKTSKHRVCQKELYNRIPNVTLWRLLRRQTLHRSTPWRMDNLYPFKCKRFRNTRHKVTFGVPLWSSFETPCITSGSYIEP